MKIRHSLPLAMLARQIGAAAMHSCTRKPSQKPIKLPSSKSSMPKPGRPLFKLLELRNSRPAVAICGPPGGKVVAFVGDPPKSVGITEFDSLDQAVAYRNSQAFKDLDPLRNKAIKITKQYTVEAEN